MLAGSMPNSATWAALVDTATKWRAPAAPPRPPARGALPLPEADLLGEERHAVEDVVDGPDDVLPVDDQRGAPGHPQGDVEDGPVLGGVDPLPPPHGLDAAPQVGPGGERGQEAD